MDIKEYGEFQELIGKLHALDEALDIIQDCKYVAPAVFRILCIEIGALQKKYENEIKGIKAKY